MVAPARERGLKSCRHGKSYQLKDVAPARERGLKLRTFLSLVLLLSVAPARERGLKLKHRQEQFERDFGRSREGAWIEI